jgi:hypothetical protein
VLQGFSHDEVAQMLGCCPKTIMRQLPDALDKLSGIFLTVGILKPIGETPKCRRRTLSRGENEKTP